MTLRGQGQGAATGGEPAGTERVSDRGLSPPRRSGRPLTVPDLLASAVSNLSAPGRTWAADASLNDGHAPKLYVHFTTIKKTYDNWKKFKI